MIRIGIIIIFSILLLSGYRAEAETVLPVDFLFQGDALAKEKKYSEAFKQYELAISGGFNQPAIYINYGWNLFLSGDIEKAVKVTEMGFQKYPEDRYLTGNLALFSFAKGDEKKGKEFYDKLFSMKLGQITYWFILKEDIYAAKDLFNKKEFYQKAQSYYLHKAKSIYHDFGSAYPEFLKIETEYQEANRYINNSEYEKAIPIVNRIEKSWNKYDSSVYKAIIYLNQGRIYYSHFKNPKMTFEYLNKSLGILDYMLSPDYYVLYPVLQTAGEVYFDLNNYSKAIEYYSRALKSSIFIATKERDRDAMYYKLGIAYYNKNDYLRALGFFNKVLNIVLDNEDVDSIFIVKNKIAECYVKMESSDKALPLYFEIADRYKQESKTDDLIKAYDQIAEIYDSRKEIENAVDYMMKALTVIKENKTGKNIAEQTLKIAEFYRRNKVLNQAEEYYFKAFHLYYAMIKDKDSAKGCLESIVVMYFENYDSDQYDNKSNAVFEYGMVYNLDMRTMNDIITDYLNRRLIKRTLFNANIGGSLKYLLEETTGLLRLSEKCQHLRYQVYFNNDIGMIYQLWGFYDKALMFYLKALSISEESGDWRDVIDTNNKIARLYYIKGNYLKSSEYYSNVEKIISQADGEAIKYGYETYNGLGDYFYKKQDYQKSLKYYNKALSISEKYGTFDGVIFALDTTAQTRAIAYNKIAKIYKNKGDYSTALDYCHKAMNAGNLDESFREEMETFERKGILITDPFVLIDIYKNIAEIYYLTGKYDEAIKYLNLNINKIEHYRSDASGSVRREFFSRMIDTYHLLILSYLEKNDYVSAFNMAEKSSSRYLVDRLQQKTNYYGNVILSDVEEYRKGIDSDTALVRYVNTDGDKIIVFIVTKDGIAPHSLSKSQFINYLNKEDFRKVLSGSFSSERGMAIEQSDSKDELFTFENIIEYYRKALANPASKDYKKISEQLFRFIFDGVDLQIPGKKNLVVIADGILGQIPFDSLICDDGRFLIEKYNIRYIQSLTVENLVEKRKFSAERFPVLAFGGGVYDTPSWNDDMKSSELRLAYLQNEAQQSLNRGGGLGEVYAGLGYNRWSNLPGTLAEVNAIKKLYPDGVIITGQDVDESFVKQMSAQGRLKSYEIIHFAVHGIVVPHVPELSAIVLSQMKKNKDGQDGYLCMNEIEDLDFNADFINLSACETGLGKIYPGEGVVGLTQAFLISGANSLSVSLWSVSDESTMVFMSEMYKLVRDKKMSYSAAMNEIKRSFITGAKKEYSHPYYWAPFVYYGK